ncbi:MAG TPA: aminoacyl-tRNA hydrolase [Planctomycetaceae bacterium]|nr:aminoacyl-tRNA hydrolase [Planctomycetaceae bacterium]
MKLIVGLGNPGRKYQETRHNIGFEIASALMGPLGSPSIKKRFDGETAEAIYQGQKVLVLCPDTYMNASGTSVRKAVDFFKLDPSGDELLVVCDDLNLPLGRLRFRKEGSAGGQKGLADIIAKLGTNHFSRLRFGIDRPPAEIEVIDFVLSKFAAQHRKVVDDAIGLAVCAALQWVVSGVSHCMNQYNAASPQS